MSIFKSTFSPTVQEQLRRRQDAMVNRTPQNIQYTNSRNAWIRMSSSVNVNSSNELAKRYVLQGGTLNNIAASSIAGNLKSGVGSDFNSAYSTKGPFNKNNYQRGIRPMPGITSIDVKSKSAYGSLREVVVNFQCWDLQQLEDLEVLYMRPGYTVLVEWGWLPYLDNGGNYKSSFIDYYDIINKPATNRTVLFKELYEKSVKYNGNYDAMFGYVKNYQWSARPDGGYDCTTTVISTGEIIESLKVNYILPKKIEKADQGLLVKEFIRPGNTNEWTNAYKKNILAGVWAEALYKIKEQGSQVPDSSILKGKVIALEIPYAKNTTSTNTNSISNGNWQSYITLEGVFDVLNAHILARSKSINGELGEPLVSMSVYYTNPDSGQNDPLLCVAHPLQVSVDPSICLIKSPLWYNQDGQSTVIATAATGVAADINFQTAESAFNLIRKGYEAFGGTDEISLKNGIKLITNQEIFAIVESLIARKGTYKNLEDVLNEELGKDDIPVANEIKVDLQKIGIKVEITPTNFVDKSGKQVSTNDVDSIKVIVPTSLQSADANVGIAQATIAKNATQAVDNLEFIKSLPLDFFYNGDPYSELGVIKNIYINVDFLYQQALNLDLESSDNKEKNEISLYNYVKNVIRAVQTAIGSVNNFEIHVDPINNNVGRVIDINFTEPDKNIYGKLFELQLHNLSSIVRNYSLQSQIFPEQSSLIAIGSQAKGGQLGMQNNTMIDFNRNLTDRIIPEKVDSQGSELRIEDNKSNITNGLAQIIDAFASFKNPATTSNNKTDYQSLVTDAKNALRDVIVYFQSITKSPGSNRNLIPTKFSCDMDGIGGLVIGHMFRLPRNVFPKGYRGEGAGVQLGNAITSIGHTISNGDWVTKIDSLNIVLDDGINTVPFSKVLLEKVIARALNLPGANENVIPSALDQPNAANLKKNLEDNKIATVEGNELNNGGEITQGIASSAFAVLATIKDRHPDITLKVTAGNDTFHQRQAGFSNHKVGKAVDFSISPSTAANQAKVEAILLEYQKSVGGAPLPTFRFLNEYKTPTRNSTGGHFHISWDVDTQGA